MILSLFPERRFSILAKQTNHYFEFCHFFFHFSFNHLLHFEKTQNNDSFVSPKLNNAILEIGLKSFITFKLDNQVSKC